MQPRRSPYTPPAPGEFPYLPGDVAAALASYRDGVHDGEILFDPNGYAHKPASMPDLEGGRITLALHYDNLVPARPYEVGTAYMPGDLLPLSPATPEEWAHVAHERRHGHG